MIDKNTVSTGRLPAGVASLITTVNEHEMARRVIATVFGVAIFSAALVVSGMTHFGLPGHSVVLWMPALMAGRGLCGYRGSSLTISTLGGCLINSHRFMPDGRVFGYMLAALAIEGVLAMGHKDRMGIVQGILLGIFANAGKIIPKLVTIAMVGGTPKHSRATLPYMLTSYFLFGVLAGLFCVMCVKAKDSIQKRREQS